MTETASAPAEIVPQNPVDALREKYRSQFAALDNENLGDIYAGAMADIEAIQDQLLTPKVIVAVITELIQQRMKAAGDTEFLHPRVEGGFTTKKKSYLNEEIAREILTLEINGMRLPADQLHGAIEEVVIPARKELKTNLTQLKQLGKKYGAVRAVLDRAVTVEETTKFELRPRAAEPALES